MQEVFEYLRRAGTYYLATVEGNQPRVRPFGTVLLTDGKLYIQTGKVKPCSKQMAINPKIEISAMDPSSEGTWLRLSATAVNDDNIEVKKAMLKDYPILDGMYRADDDNMQVLYLTDATAEFCSFTAEPRVINF